MTVIIEVLTCYFWREVLCTCSCAKGVSGGTGTGCETISFSKTHATIHNAHVIAELKKSLTKCANLSIAPI
jgi:hypothetical protein